MIVTTSAIRRPAGRGPLHVPRLAAIIVLVVAAYCPADLSEPGPYGAGWTTVTVSRPGGGTFDARLFYPAVGSGQGVTYDGGGAPYPAVSFGHGWITAVTRYQSTLEHLATHGYFVIASLSYGGLFPDHSAFADDLRWCLSYLEQENADPSSPLYQHVITACYGLSGHSMGGGASILAASRDARVCVVANMAAAETNPSAVEAVADVWVPVILIAGDEDAIAPPESHTILIYDGAGPPRRLPLLDGGWHCGFLDSSFIGCDSGSMPRSTQLAWTRSALTAVFNLYLRGNQAVWPDVWGPPLLSDPLADNTRTDPGIDLQPAEAAAHGYGGQTVCVELTLTNTGRQATSFSVFTEDHMWPVWTEPAQTASLAPGEAAPVALFAEIPDEPGAGIDSVLLSARHDGDGGTRAFASLVIERRLRGDLDGDGAVDPEDLAAFLACLSGPETEPSLACVDADLDLDHDADLHDFATLQRNLGAGL